MTMTLETLLEHVNTYLDGGTPQEALERLGYLDDELQAIREALHTDVQRSAPAEDAP